MSNTYEFTKLSEVEALAEVPENANALVEVDGAIKRVSGSGLGGDKGIKTAIFKKSSYDEFLAGVQTAGAVITYSCLNMTYDEAYQLVMSGEPLQAILMTVSEGAIIFPAFVGYMEAATGIYSLVVGTVIQGVGETLYWTADGLSTDAPTA